MEYKLKWPDVKGRKEIKAIDVKYGDVVAVAEFCRNSFTNEIEFGRTGLAVMESPDWAIWYINLCKEEGREWVNDPLPDDVMLFEPTEEEEYFGKLILLQELFNTSEVFCAIKGPTSVTNRYITEDISTGLVLWSSIGKVLKVPTPNIDAIIVLGGTLLQRDFYKEGLTIEKLGIVNANCKEDLINAV